MPWRRKPSAPPATVARTANQDAIALFTLAVHGHAGEAAAMISNELSVRCADDRFYAITFLATLAGFMSVMAKTVESVGLQVRTDDIALAVTRVMDETIIQAVGEQFGE